MKEVPELAKGARPSLPQEFVYYSERPDDANAALVDVLAALKLWVDMLWLSGS
jgi:hypothetical protein